MQADMKRGNRPVAFYADKHKDADSGYLNTNRAFLYGTVDGALHSLCLHWVAKSGVFAYDTAFGTVSSCF